MATKPTKYLRNTGHTKEYWINAAKQIVWPVDYEEQHIRVPHLELETAKENLIVQHFCNNGFHVQSAISVEKTIPFVAPVTLGPIFRGVVIQEETGKQSPYSAGQKFRVISDGCELIISNLSSGKVQLDYLNRNKPTLLLSEDLLTRNLKQKYWISI